jgi:hypothetical protein
MNIDNARLNWKLLFTTAVTSLLFATSASATPIFDPTVRDCTERNCSAVVLGGTVNGFLTAPMPWTIQVYAGTRECLRVEVTSQETDMEMRVVAPDGSRTWVSDDSGELPCPLCPVLAIPTRQQPGWYTVHVGEFGGASVQANFTIAYGRYARSSPNCNASLSPAGAAPAGTVDKNSESPAPDPKFAPGR